MWLGRFTLNHAPNGAELDRERGYRHFGPPEQGRRHSKKKNFLKSLAHKKKLSHIEDVRELFGMQPVP